MDQITPSAHLQKLVAINLDYVATELLPLIDNEYAKVASQEVLERIKLTINALTDGDPANKAQVALIWGSVTSDPELINLVRSGLLEAVSKIDEPILADGLKLLVNPLVATLVAVADKDKADGAQLKAIWKNFIESPEFLGFLLSNLGWIIGKIIKNDKTEKWIMTILNALIKQ